MKRRGVEPGSIIVVGHSLGGGSASWLAEHRKVGGLMLWSTFSSTVATVMPAWIIPIDWFDTGRRLADVHIPVAIIHGTADEVIAVDNAATNEESANEPKRLELVEGAHHHDVIQRGPTQFDDLVDWLLSSRRS